MIDVAGRELRKETAELFAETQMRPDDRERFRVEVRHVDRVANCSFEQRGADRLRDLDADTFLRFGGGSAEMRSKNKIRRGRKGESFGKGSVSKTSSAAAATCRSCNALAKAASSINPPRAQLMMRTPRFIFDNRSRLIR